VVEQPINPKLSKMSKGYFLKKKSPLGIQENIPKIKNPKPPAPKAPNPQNVPCEGSALPLSYVPKK